jgi:hypothetical protein
VPWWRAVFQPDYGAGEVNGRRTSSAPSDTPPTVAPPREPVVRPPTLTREMRPSPTPCQFIAPSFDTLALPIRPFTSSNPSNVIHPGHPPRILPPYQVSFQLPHAHRPCPRRRPAVGPPPQPWAALPGLLGRSRKGGPAQRVGPPFLESPGAERNRGWRRGGGVLLSKDQQAEINTQRSTRGRGAHAPGPATIPRQRIGFALRHGMRRCPAPEKWRAAVSGRWEGTALTQSRERGSESPHGIGRTGSHVERSVQARESYPPRRRAASTASRSPDASIPA